MSTPCVSCLLQPWVSPSEATRIGGLRGRYSIFWWLINIPKSVAGTNRRFMLVLESQKVHRLQEHRDNDLHNHCRSSECLGDTQ